MLKKLKNKFILINMLLVFLVMVSVAAANMISLAHEFKSSYESALNFEAFRDDGGFKQDFSLPGKWNPDAGRNMSHILGFSIIQGSDGMWAAISPTVNVDDETAQLLVARAQNAESEQGFLADYGVAYKRVDGSTIAFADMQSEFEQLKYNVSITSLILMLALIAFYFISRFLAGWALRPVERSWEQQQQFIANASHELKTPLTVILANTDIMEKEIGDSQWLTATKKEAVRMKGLVEDMLFLARTDALRQPAPETPESLSETVWESILAFEVVAFESNVSMESDVAPNCITPGDAKQLKQLVMILLDNAVKYTPAGGKVAVRLYACKDRLHLSVQNSGDPIPQENIGHIFERFYRADDARTHGGGYGLGLAIAREIADRHHGRIAVQSDLERGTVFTVTLSQAASARRSS